ncbi:MAG: hypothetical protein KAJ14_02210 [Candidatus Omnitrophica bacterium]|nr:hypothetical protein [Candidatus Omnitrophota bacterium]
MMKKKIAVNFTIFVLIQCFSLLNLSWAGVEQISAKNHREYLSPRIQITGSLLDHNYWQLSNKSLPGVEILKEKPGVVNKGKGYISKIVIFLADFLFPVLALADDKNVDVEYNQIKEILEKVFHIVEISLMVIGVVVGTPVVLYWVYKLIYKICERYIFPELIFRRNGIPLKYWKRVELKVSFHDKEMLQEQAYVEGMLNFLLKFKKVEWKKKNIVKAAIGQLDSEFHCNFVIALRVLKEFKTKESTEAILNAIIKVNHRFRKESDYKLMFSVLNELGVSNTKIISALQNAFQDSKSFDLPVSEGIVHFLINNHDVQINGVLDFIEAYLKSYFSLNIKNKDLYDALPGELIGIKKRAFEDFLLVNKNDFDWENNFVNRLKRLVKKLKMFNLMDDLKKLDWESRDLIKTDIFSYSDIEKKIARKSLIVHPHISIILNKIEDESRVGNNLGWLKLVSDYYYLSPEKAFEFVLLRLHNSDLAVLFQTAETIEKILKENTLNDIQKQLLKNKLLDFESRIKTHKDRLKKIKTEFSQSDDNELYKLKKQYKNFPMESCEYDDTPYNEIAVYTQYKMVPVDSNAYRQLFESICKMEERKSKTIPKITELTKQIQILEEVVTQFKMQLYPKNVTLEQIPQIKYSLVMSVPKTQLISQSI